jgi:TetR/AcrR family transcriptional regulator
MSPVKPRRRAELRRDIETRILDAAERVFAEAGFEGASTSRIAAVAGLPKANLHYYFGTKDTLYRAVLTGILDLWLGAADGFEPGADPAAAIEAYVRAKMEWSRSRPLASRVFANELLHGAPFLRDFLESDLKDWVEAKGRVIREWVAAGRMAPVEPRHLFFMLWAATQTYADFAVQVRAVLGLDELDDGAFERATAEVVAFVLRGCGLCPREEPALREQSRTQRD